MQKLSNPKTKVILDDAAEFLVQTDNRDLVAWDMTASKQRWPQPDSAPFLWATFLAWNALKRSGDYKDIFDHFVKDCLEATVLPDDEADGDPTLAALEVA